MDRPVGRATRQTEESPAARPRRGWLAACKHQKGTLSVLGLIHPSPHGPSNGPLARQKRPSTPAVSRNLASGSGCDTENHLQQLALRGTEPQTIDSGAASSVSHHPWPMPSPLDSEGLGFWAGKQTEKTLLSTHGRGAWQWNKRWCYARSMWAVSTSSN
jgi:hypothetical protein